VTQGSSQRHEIRYATLRWNDVKWFNGIFAVVLAGLLAYNLLSHKPVDQLIIVLPVPVAFLAATYLNRLNSYLVITPTGVRIRYRLASFEIPYSAIVRVRKQPLAAAFQAAERRRYLNRFVRRLLRDPAVYIRIDSRQSDLLAQAERQLGPRLVLGSDIVVPISDTDSFVSEMKSRLRST
jgi:hypothetical protein